MMATFSCQTCSSEFKCKRYLNRHVKIHNRKAMTSLAPTKVDVDTNKEPFVCDLCEKPYKTKYDLTTHKKYVHSGISERNKLLKHKCPYEDCGRRFSKVSNFKEHLMRHTGEKKYTCLLCSKKFRKYSDLSRHIRIHTTEKPYCCPVSDCLMRFSRKDLADIHIWMKHRNLIKSFEIGGKVEYHLNGHRIGKLWACHSKISVHKVPCTYCGRPFDKGGLENHIRTHTNEKPFKCDKCSYESKEAGALRTHILRIHSEIKEPKLTCPICYGKTSCKKFKLQAHLNYHMATLHQKRQLSEFTKCSVCRKKIITNIGMSHVYRLITHYSRMHNIDLVAQVLLVRNSPSDVYYN